MLSGYKQNKVVYNERPVDFNRPLLFHIERSSLKRLLIHQLLIPNSKSLVPLTSYLLPPTSFPPLSLFPRSIHLYKIRYQVLNEFPCQVVGNAIGQLRGAFANVQVSSIGMCGAKVYVLPCMQGLYTAGR